MFDKKHLCVVMVLWSSYLLAQDSIVKITTPDTLHTIKSVGALDSAKIDSFYRCKQIDITLADNPSLYYEVFKWLGTKYCYGGNSFRGIDCSGFVGKVYKNTYGKDLPHSSAEMFSLCQPLPLSEVLAEGDLVFFKIKQGRISHVGIYLQHGKFAHASVFNGVTISDLSESYYQRYFFRAGRLE